MNEFLHVLLDQRNPAEVVGFRSVLVSLGPVPDRLISGKLWRHHVPGGDIERGHQDDHREDQYNYSYQVASEPSPFKYTVTDDHDRGEEDRVFSRGVKISREGDGYSQ